MSHNSSRNDPTSWCRLQCPVEYYHNLGDEMKLRLLKGIEDHIATTRCHHPLLKSKEFADSWNNTTTPLILACQRGELGSVKHLIETRGFNARAFHKYDSDSSNSYFSKIEIEYATPLFIAAFNGNDKTVRHLLEKGANVSVGTQHFSINGGSDQWTPLYGAVSDVHFDPTRPLLEQQVERSAVVCSLLEFGADPVADSFRTSDGMPMWVEKMCGADAIIALINHGLDLKRRNPLTGETLLHCVASRSRYFTEEHSLAIVKLLVEKGADLLALDENGYTPLLKAADDTNDNHRSLNLAVLDFLLERAEYDQMKKIEAVEMAGATILSKAQNAPHFPKAFNYWCRSLLLRHQIKTVKIVGRKIGRHLEWTTLADLARLMVNPEEYTNQALLVKLRILSSCDGHRYHSLSNSYINYITDSNSLEIGEKFIHIMDIRWGMFDLIISRLYPLQTDRFLWIRIAEDVDQLISTLSTLQREHPTLLNFERIKTSLDLILLATDRSPFTVPSGERITNDYSGINYRRTLFSQHLFHLLKYTINLTELMSNQNNWDILTQSLSQLGPCRLGHLLFQSCEDLWYFKSISFVRVLLDAGADPNLAVENNKGNTTLHVATALRNRGLGDVTGRLLVEFGAKLYQVNRDGKTALDIWIELNETEDKWNEEAGGWSARPEWCCPLPTLLCLAARVIRVHKIPYADGATPTNLHSFIELRNLR